MQCNSAIVPRLRDDFFNLATGFDNMRILLLLIVFFTFLACGNNQETGVALLPDIKNTDSVELLYFNEPGNQRFFTYLPLKDKAFIRNLIDDLTGKVQPERDENTCVKEGKIYMHKNGKIFNTVFFSYADSSCLFLRFIKNGKLYYFSVSESLREKLAEYRPMAKEPTAADSSGVRE